jgi:hypothetical protein
VTPFLTVQAFELELSLLGCSLDALSDIEAAFQARGSVVVWLELLSGTFSAILLHTEAVFQHCRSPQPWFQSLKDVDWGFSSIETKQQRMTDWLLLHTISNTVHCGVRKNIQPLVLRNV